MSRIETYMAALLSNPEFIVQVRFRYGNGFNMGNLANAVTKLESELKAHLLEDKPFDIESFTRDSDRPFPWERSAEAK